MGFLKSITRPISKVLDKIIPNEIKPALPYLSAFAPFYMPPGMQFAKSGIFSNPMFTRALMSGGANLAVTEVNASVNTLMERLLLSKVTQNVSMQMRQLLRESV